MRVFMYIQALKYKGGRSSIQYRIYVRDPQLERKEKAESKRNTSTDKSRKVEKTFLEDFHISDTYFYK